MSRAVFVKEIPHTRDRMLREAARLFAERGFGGTSIEDIGAACGMSGPAVYKHFPSKNAILARLLLDISQQLVEGGRLVAATSVDPAATLGALIDFHAAFSISEPDLIRVQDRDLTSLNSVDSRRVRRMQREYVELWVSLLQQIDSSLTVEVARLRAHAGFGLLNSTPHSGSNSVAREELIKMTQRAFDLGDNGR
jgi:AcrR family transcriptional regulator